MASGTSPLGVEYMFKNKAGGGKRGMPTVTIEDVMQSNGVIHVVDTVMLP